MVDGSAFDAEVTELLGLLRAFVFPYPDKFQSEDGGCTEVLLADEQVQKLRTYFERVGAAS